MIFSILNNRNLPFTKNMPTRRQSADHTERQRHDTDIPDCYLLTEALVPEVRPGTKAHVTWYSPKNRPRMILPNTTAKNHAY